MDDGIKKTTAGVLLIVAGLSGFLAIIGKSAVVGGAFVKVWAGLKLAFFAIVPVLKVIGLLLIGTFGLVPALITAAVLAIAAIIAFMVVKWDFVKEKFNQVKQFLGFGGDSGDLDVSGNASLSSRTAIDFNATITAPAGVVQETSTKTSGDTGGLNIGVNNVEAL